MYPIVGTRFRSTVRTDFDLCAHCVQREDALDEFEIIAAPKGGCGRWRGRGCPMARCQKDAELAKDADAPKDATPPPELPREQAEATPTEGEGSARVEALDLQSFVQRLAEGFGFVPPPPQVQQGGSPQGAEACGASPSSGQSRQDAAGEDALAALARRGFADEVLNAAALDVAAGDVTGAAELLQEFRKAAQEGEVELRAMGFLNRRAMLRALLRHKGSIGGAVGELIE
jgi:hypothetical protein